MGLKVSVCYAYSNRKLLASSVSSPYFSLNDTFFKEQVSMAVSLYSEDSDFNLLPGK